MYFGLFSPLRYSNKCSITLSSVDGVEFVGLRDARAYFAAFAAGLFRDVGDLVGAVDDGASPIVPVVVLVLGIAAISAVLRAGGLAAEPTWASITHRCAQQRKHGECPNSAGDANA